MPFSNLSSLFPLSSKREIDIAFDLNVDFEATDVVMQSASMSSGSGQAGVDTYVKACKCDNFESFTCNTDPLSPNTILYVCITSIDSDVEIHWLDGLELFQRNALGNETLDVVSSANIQNDEISSMTVKNATAVGVATVVPSRFFSYSGVSFLDVFGTVEMKLVGGRRRLGDLAHDTSPNAPFKLTIEVEREAEGTPYVESTVFSGSITKALGTSLLVVLSAIVLLAVHV
jgi:hypothetical protein